MTGVAPLRVAVIGCGNISGEYLGTLSAAPTVEVAWCADLDRAAAARQAQRYGVGRHGLPAEALADDGVELVVNLTSPAAHAPVAKAALEAGKHVWNEKPLATDLAASAALLALAEQRGLRLGCAPDTVLGPGLTAVRELIAAGGIGTPLTALTLMQGPGPDVWHPNPAFFFQPGAGPLFDMGPYYLTTLALLFGPAERAVSVARTSRPSRTVANGPLAGTTVPVAVPTHVSGMVEYASGAAATMIFSFDSPLNRHGFVEITGSEATLALPDPNAFGGTITRWPLGADTPEVIEAPAAGNHRGIGVLDMGAAIRAGVPHQAGGDLAHHVLEVMCALDRSATEGRFVPITSTFPAPPVRSTTLRR
ncbi:Gfo/Idh/MocA family protein [Plantactinospora siamensis]|uniref:Gfo/Idh/MocA family protein n=1 Tax=Plantactinospora siamensis TaxID=555372 RepID=A0ABV6P3E4_9ACTN